jgi:hypothetical protein
MVLRQVAWQGGNDIKEWQTQGGYLGDGKDVEILID